MSDAHGSLTLQYNGFDVLISHSKVSDGLTPSEIQGENGSLLIEHISDCRKVTRIMRGDAPEELTAPQVDNTMEYEARVFAERIGSKAISTYGFEDDTNSKLHYHGCQKKRLVSCTLLITTYNPNDSIAKD